jgi:cytochrome P450
MMWRKSFNLVDSIMSEIREQGPGKDFGTVEITTWASRATPDIMGLAGMGNDFNSLKNSEAPLARYYEELLRSNPTRLFHFFLSMVLGRKMGEKVPMKVNYNFQRLTGAIRGISEQIVRDKREGMKHGGNNFDILGVLLRANHFSDEELSDHLLTFLAAGQVFFLESHTQY